MTDTITPCLWFDGDAEEAVAHYTALLPQSHVDRVLRAPTDYPGGGQEGAVLLVEFTLMGRPFQALNGGPAFSFTEALSLSIPCDTQEEIARYTAALSAHPEAEQCGWVKDRWGLSWQIVPRALMRLLAGPDRARASRVMAAMMEMKVLDIAALEAA